MMPKPKLIVISAPSGCGKTTIAKEILNRHPDMLFSVSATTRPKRGTETHGSDYYFLTKDDFTEKIRKNQLIEWEEIYGNYYGSLKSEVERALGSGRCMLFDIDVKGALAIKRQYPDDSVLIFIRPPDLETLTSRLTNRKTEDESALKKRLDRVPMELEKGNEFDYSVINDRLADAIERVNDIINREISGE